MIWKAAIHAAAWGLMLLGTLTLLGWGHRLRAVLLSALLIGAGILLGAIARLSPAAASRERTPDRPARPPAWPRRLSD
jgi:hypothetical protein